MTDQRYAELQDSFRVAKTCRKCKGEGVDIETGNECEPCEGTGKVMVSEDEQFEVTDNSNH